MNDGIEASEEEEGGGSEFLLPPLMEIGVAFNCVTVAFVAAVLMSVGWLK